MASTPQKCFKTLKIRHFVDWNCRNFRSTTANNIGIKGLLGYHHTVTPWLRPWNLSGTYTFWCLTPPQFFSASVTVYKLVYSIIRHDEVAAVDYFKLCISAIIIIIIIISSSTICLLSSHANPAWPLHTVATWQHRLPAVVGGGCPQLMQINTSAKPNADRQQAYAAVTRGTDGRTRATLAHVEVYQMRSFPLDLTAGLLRQCHPYRFTAEHWRDISLNTDSINPL